MSVKDKKALETPVETVKKVVADKEVVADKDTVEEKEVPKDSGKPLIKKRVVRNPKTA
jgi:hypothetical protein